MALGMALGLSVLEIVAISVLAVFDIIKAGQAIRRQVYGEIIDLTNKMIDLIRVSYTCL